MGRQAEMARFRKRKEELCGGFGETGGFPRRRANSSKNQESVPRDPGAYDPTKICNQREDFRVDTSLVWMGIVADLRLDGIRFSATRLRGSRLSAAHLQTPPLKVESVRLSLRKLRNWSHCIPDGALTVSHDFHLILFLAWPDPQSPAARIGKSICNV